MAQIKSLQTGIKFKDTPIGKIPVDWEVTYLEKVAFLEYGASLPEKKRLEGPIPVYGSNGIVGYHNEKLLKGPGIIIGRKGTVGAVTWSDNDFWPIDTTYFISKAQSKGILNLRWFYYLLFNLHLEKLNAATGIPGINRSAVHSLIIPLPPLPEQKKIAEILTTVDDAIEETDRIIEKTKELKKGLMQQLLTRGIGHKKFKKTETGVIPEEWNVTELSNIFKLSSGKPRPLHISNIQTEKMPYPVYGGNGVIGFTDQFLIETETVAIGRVGEYCGSVYKTSKISWLTDNALFATEINESIVNLDFLVIWLAFINLNKFKKQTGQPLMTQSVIYSIKFPVPSLREQKKISEVLTEVDLEVNNQESYKQNLETLKKSLMQILLTGRVRVKLH